MRGRWVYRNCLTCKTSFSLPEELKPVSQLLYIRGTARHELSLTTPVELQIDLPFREG